jgi:hypothetical protein
MQISEKVRQYPFDLPTTAIATKHKDNRHLLFLIDCIYMYYNNTNAEMPNMQGGTSSEHFGVRVQETGTGLVPKFFLINTRIVDRATFPESCNKSARFRGYFP